MPGPAFLVGDSVSLHAWEEEDLEFLQENRNRKEIRRPLTDVPPRNRHQLEEHIEERVYGDGEGLDFLICTGDEEAMRIGDEEALTRVGEVAIPWINQPHGNGMLMYWTAPDHQGNGYVKEATGLLLDHVFGERRMNKVWAMVIEPNKPSQAVLESLGFVQEGTYRKDIWYEGEFVDARRYSILADEWMSDE